MGFSTLGIIPSGFVKIVVENCPFTVDLPIKSGDFSIAMYQRDPEGISLLEGNHPPECRPQAIEVCELLSVTHMFAQSGEFFRC